TSRGREQLSSSATWTGQCGSGSRYCWYSAPPSWPVCVPGSPEGLTLMSEQVAVVTGGGSGIGAAVVDVLKGRGYRVGVLDMSGAADADHVVAVDVSDGAAVAGGVDEIRRQLGPISALVTSA